MIGTQNTDLYTNASGRKGKEWRKYLACQAEAEIGEESHTFHTIMLGLLGRIMHGVGAHLSHSKHNAEEMLLAKCPNEK